MDSIFTSIGSSSISVDAKAWHDAYNQPASTTTGTLTEIQYIPKYPQASPCPACGYCPHCGRGGYVAPYNPYPWTPWIQPFYTYCSSNAQGPAEQNRG